jgi:hypothetical protein
MKRLKLLITQWLNRPLPKTSEEFKAFADDVLLLGGLEDNANNRFAIASAIQHLGPVTNKKDYSFFAKSIHKLISNHVAHAEMEAIKKAQIEEYEKKKAEQESEAKLVDGPESTST